MLNRHLRQKSLNNMFNACRVEKNMFLPSELSKQITDYQLEDIISPPSLDNILASQSQQVIMQNTQQPITQGIYLETEGASHKNNKSDNNNSDNNNSEEEVEDFTDAWNNLQFNQMQKAEQKQKQSGNDIADPGQDRSSRSSLQLTEQQIKKWTFSFQNSDQRISIEKPPQIKRIEAENIYREQDSDRVTFSNQAQEEEEDFLILDNPFSLMEGKQIQAFSLSQSNKQRCKKYGPWQYSTETYEIYEEWSLKLVQQIQSLWTSSNLNIEKKQINNCLTQPLQKINWELQEEKRPEVKGNKSKRNCRTKLIEHGKDFLIFDHTEFLLLPITQQNHIYFGLRALSQTQSCRQFMPYSGQFETRLKEYLYLTSSGQCLLQAQYLNLAKSEVKWKEVKQFLIRLSITGEILAVCKRKIFDEDKDKKEVIQIRKYDFFEKKECDFLGVIQSKISSFNHQWYCDTTINVPKKKCFSNKPTSKNWEKFKIQLKVSQTGNIVAQLGIFDAESSVTNCILFGQTKASQFMMGTIAQQDDEVNYILRVAGLSPLVGFATALSRKLFVLSS